MKSIEKLSIDSIRVLSAEMVEKAQSGHPGTAIGAAPAAYTLWAKHINFTHKDKKWINRDRFILSAGHASPLLYSILHLFGFDISIDDIKKFRQLGSKTAGHPEYGITDGVEATTGPLGAGLAMGVGMAMAQKHMAAKFNTDKYKVFDNKIFVLAGDGCLMEGISGEASSLAGTLKLNNLIILYDSNNITIDGNTDLAFNENVRKRYEAYGFDTYYVNDANNIEEINNVISKAKKSKNKPAFIEIKSKIGYGTLQENSESCHGAPIGKDSIKFLKKNLNYPDLNEFEISENVYRHFKNIVRNKEKKYEKWLKMFESYKEENELLYKKLMKFYEDITVEDILSMEDFLKFDLKDEATRISSFKVLNKLKDKVQNLLGGSADLASSNKTLMKDVGRFSFGKYDGRNIYFGIRELAMTAIANGMILFGGLKVYTATFFVFVDYMKPMLRLSSLMGIPQICILTHDSIGVGEDGPTHQPVEQLTMLRSTPNLVCFRPADAFETAIGWALAISSKNTPYVLALSRQNLPQIKGTGKGAIKGGYIIYETNDNPDIILIASGSEVSIICDAIEEIEKMNYSLRIVSMPSLDLFDKQDELYKKSIIPETIERRIIVEAGSSFSWLQFKTEKTRFINIDHFGESAPAKDLFLKFGFTKDNVIKLAKELLNEI